MPGVPDIFIPLGPGSVWQDHELRYSLRSIEQFGRNYGRIFVVGHVPAWLRASERLVLCPRNEEMGHKNWRIAGKTLWTFEHTDIADDAVQWNDDYILTAETDLAALRPLWKCALHTAAERHRVHAYRMELSATALYLDAAGAPTLHYDLHVPVIFRRDAFVGLRPAWEASRLHPHGFVVRSTYFDLVGAPDAQQGRDCKLDGGTDLVRMREKIADRWIFSFGDAAIMRGVAVILREMFPDACSHERHGNFHVRHNTHLNYVSV